MNRRRFFGLLAAAPVAIAPATSAKWPMSLTYTDWQQMERPMQTLKFHKDAYTMLWPSLDGVHVVHDDGKLERISYFESATR